MSSLFRLSHLINQPAARRIHWRRWFLLVVIIAMVLFVVTLFSVVSLTRRQAAGRVLSVVQDDVLLNLVTGEQEGTARRERRENDVWYVFASVRLPAVEEGSPYHGWLQNETNGDVRYMGEFFPVQEGQWSITYTTQEDVQPFTGVLVSRETQDVPVKPANTVTSWRFNTTTSTPTSTDE